MGDTCFTPEMKELGKVNLAFIPIDEIFTMDIDEAVQADLTISPEIVVPIHDMGKNDPKILKKKIERISKIRVKILGIGEDYKL